MTTFTSSLRLSPHFHWLVLLLALAAACEETASGSPPSLCPQCGPYGGGETSDHGGSMGPCGLFVVREALSRSEAVEHGFDMQRIEAAIEREIDAPLHWGELPWGADAIGEEARGYEPETRIRASVAITGYEHVWPDPRYCDGTRCWRDDVEGVDEIEIEQTECGAHLLLLGIEVQLETLDGAIHAATAVGEAAYWGESYDPDADYYAEYPIGHAYANLGDVTGSLELYPPDLPAHVPQLSGGPAQPHAGSLIVVLEFGDDETSGTVWPSMGFRQDDDDGQLIRVLRYEPLFGSWPEPDPAWSEPGEAGPDDAE